MAVQVSVIGSGADHEARGRGGRAIARRARLHRRLRRPRRGDGGRGAWRKGAGGTTIGILPGTSRDDANEWIDHVVVTGLGHARNAVVAATGDAVIAIGGSDGTLTEIGFARSSDGPS